MADNTSDWHQGLSVPDNLKDIRECVSLLVRYDNPPAGYGASRKTKEALRDAVRALRVAVTQAMVPENE